MTFRSILTLLLLFLFCSIGQAQENVTIGVIIDGPDKGMEDYAAMLKEETRSLLQNNYAVHFKDGNGEFNMDNITQIYDQMSNDPSIDYIVTTGLMGSSLLLQKENISVPSHASFVIDSDLFGVSKTADKTSGIHNLSYTELNFDPAKDLEVFQEMYDFNKLGIIIPDLSDQYSTAFGAFFDGIMNDLGKDYEFIQLSSIQNSFDADVDAAYFTAFANMTDEEVTEVIAKVNARKLPTFALYGRENVEMGALAGYSPHDNWNVQVRRIAINILKTLDGNDPADFPVEINSIGSDFVINMLTAEKIGFYPKFEILGEADLINMTEQLTDVSYNLRSAIIEALNANLDLKIASYDLLVADKDIRYAIADYFPQADLSVTGLGLDKKIHENPASGKAPFNLTADATINQAILSIPAITNIIISKLSREVEDHIYKQEELNVIFESAQAYLNILLAKSNVRIQNENVSVTRSNLNISEQKVAVGYSGEADHLRWESQFALNKIDLSDALSQLNSARYNLNRYLNKDVDAQFRTEEVSLLADDFLMASDELINDFIQDPLSVRKFTDFLVEESFRNLPELKQIESAINIQEKYLKWHKINMEVPSVGGQFGLQHSFYNSGPNSDALTYSRPYWSSGVSVSLPISRGGKNFIQKQITAVNIDQLDLQEENTRKLLELQIRSNIENAAASYNRFLLSIDAAESARQSLDIAQDSYSEGIINVTDLIDVQNSTLQAEQLLSSSVYEFYLDFLAVERSIGFFYSLATEEERQGFRDRLTAFMIIK